MKNKKGFISVSIIYSFFIVFLLIMLSMLASYINKSFLIDKLVEDPSDIISDPNCEGKNLSYCLKFHSLSDTSGVDDENSLNNKIPKETTTRNLTRTSCLTDDMYGMYKVNDDYYDSSSISYYYAGEVDNNYVSYDGLIWRIVRINGDGSIRLIYAGEADENGALIEESNPYISIKNIFSEYVKSCEGPSCSKWENVDINKTRFNYFWIFKKFNTGLQNILQDYNDLTSRTYTGFFSNYYNNINSNLNSLITREEILTFLAAEGYDTYYSIPGGILFWNIAYMNNHTHLTYQYDNLFDNQDDSELKTYIDTWYENWQEKASKSEFIVNDAIFCGDKNLEQALDENDRLSTNLSKAFDDYSSMEISPNNVGGFLSTTAIGTYVFSGYNRLGPKDDTLYSKIGKTNIDGGMLACQPTATNSALIGDKIPMGEFGLGNTAINLSDYSAGDTNIVYKVRSVIDCSEAESKLSYYTFENCGWKRGKISWYYSCDKVEHPISYPVCKFNLGDNSKIEYYTASSTTTRLKKNASKIGDTINHQIGNGALTYPVATLSADEAYFAGALTKGSCPTYLDDELGNGDEFWTMTLAYTNTAGGGAKYYAVKKDSDETSSLILKNDTYENNRAGAYIRPVINIKDVSSDEYCAVGNNPGTKGNPYKIGEGC